MKSRIVIIFFLFVSLWAALFVRAAVVQILPNQRLEELQKKQFEKRVSLRSRRGAIVDRNGKELAGTISSYSLYADPSMIDQPWEEASRIANALGHTRQDIYKKIRNPKGRFVWIERFMDEQSKVAIETLNLPGLGFIQEPKRVYPNRKLLSQVLGFVGSDEQGLEGLELVFDDVLGGKEKHVIMPRDARGRPLLADGRILSEIPDGADIELTIDSQLQFLLEQELELATDTHEADSAVGVILDAHTSQILAMANSPGYDLNHALNFTASIRRNRAITDVLEPGSTIKSFVIGFALENKMVKPSTRYDIEGGKLKIGRRVIRDSHPPKDSRKQKVSEILAHSSNVGLAKIAFDLKSQKLYEGLMSLGFGSKSGVDLPGESPGILNSPPWNKHLLSNISFGHGIAATPLQVANAYAAIANGGELKKPYIVRSITSADGRVKEYFEPQVVRRVFSASVASTLTLMLREAASDSGTGKNAQIAGFPVAGKTGTAQKVDTRNGGYMEGAYISSFAGFVPAHDPRFVIYIAVDNPKEEYYGSQVAAPIFARLAQFAVRRAGLSPVLISQENLVGDARKNSKLDLKGQQLEAIDKLSDRGFAKGVVPSLRGLSLREVLKRIRGHELDVKFVGSGVVLTTQPKAGEPIKGPLRVKLGKLDEKKL